MELHTRLRSDAARLRAQWHLGFANSPLRFRRDILAAQYDTAVDGLIEAIAVAVSSSLEHLAPGNAAVRDLERECAFVGARVASDGATGYDVAAVIATLAKVVADYLIEVQQPTEPGTIAGKVDRLFDWLMVVALDAFANARVDAAAEQFADQLEQGTPVVTLVPRVPAVLFVGAPSAALLEGLLARALLLVVGIGAPSLILEVAGLAESAHGRFGDHLEEFVAQARVRHLHVIVAGAPKALQQRVRGIGSATGVSVTCCDAIEAAIAAAMEHAGQRLVQFDKS